MDVGLSVQTLWDQLVPKDVDLNTAATEDDIDWDDGAVATPFEEPGHINWNDMVELGQRPIGLGEKEVFMCFGNGGMGFPHVDTTDEAFFRGSMRMGSNHKVRVRQASYWMAAVTAPNWDETTTAEPTTLADGEWSLLTYPDVMFDMMLPDILGLTETGATEPFATAAQVAVDLVEPIISEDTTTQFRNAGWHVWTKYAALVATPGRPQMSKLSSGLPG